MTHNKFIPTGRRNNAEPDALYENEERIRRRVRRMPEGIYAVITEEFCVNGDAVKTLKDILKAGVKMVQLREKKKSRKRITALAKKFRKLTKSHKALFFVNDYPDIAAASGADGVHLGQDDGPVREIRKKYRELLIGVSTHNMTEAVRAQQDGADYINIGPVFSTSTKKTGKYRPLGINKFRKIAGKVTVPFSCMGGIKAKNLGRLVKAGAARPAMITEITMAEDIPGKIKELNNIIMKNRARRGRKNSSVRRQFVRGLMPEIIA